MRKRKAKSGGGLTMEPHSSRPLELRGWSNESAGSLSRVREKSSSIHSRRVKIRRDFLPKRIFL